MSIQKANIGDLFTQKKYNENQLIELAVEKLGLNDLYHFEANKKIIENFI